MRIRSVVSVLISASLLLAAPLASVPPPFQGSPQASAGPAVAANGMVSSAHPLATEAGVEILAAGGNAFDAAVAVAAVLNVVEPEMSGIGGYGTILTHHAAQSETLFLNCSGRIPKKLDSDVFRPPTPNWRENRSGAKAVSTPGNLNCWEAMSKKYGKLPWARLFNAAIRAADEGFPMPAWPPALMQRAYDEFPAAARAAYGKNGKPLSPGENLVQKDLAQSFRMIARDGAKALHGGPLGRAIADELRASRSFLTLEDLRENRAEWWQPIRIRYRGYEVVTSSPPANSFDMLVRLGMLSRLDMRKLGHNTADALHWFAEVTKHGFWTRLRYASDPDVAPVPLEVLLSEKYWQEQIAAIDPQRAKPFVPPGAQPAPQSHTTHFVVADRWGNVVSATQTLGNIFGSRIMAPGTGIWLNNSLAYSTFEPKGNPMDAFPGRHKLSGDCPTLIFRDGKLWAALGTPGGHTIGQTIPQMVMNLIDFQMDIHQAIAAPRISFAEPDQLAVAAIPAAVREQLTARGHRVRTTEQIGAAHGLSIEYGADGNPARFAGAADPRRSGLAKGIP